VEDTGTKWKSRACRHCGYEHYRYST
jgi:hypothetical protein